MNSLSAYDPPRHDIHPNQSADEDRVRAVAAFAASIQMLASECVRCGHTDLELRGVLEDLSFPSVLDGDYCRTEGVGMMQLRCEQKQYMRRTQR